MSKKKVAPVAGKDGFCRMNFLYQASMLFAGKNNTLSSYYGKLCGNIAKKTVLRCEPGIKRNICKRCGLALEPGLTAELSVEAVPQSSGKRSRNQRRRKQKNIDENAQVTVKCMQCQYERSFRLNSNYSLWLEDPNAVVPPHENKVPNKSENDEKAK